MDLNNRLIVMVNQSANKVKLLMDLLNKALTVVSKEALDNNKVGKLNNKYKIKLSKVNKTLVNLTTAVLQTVNHLIL
jgi:DNA polymerase III psi subunit